MAAVDLVNQDRLASVTALSSGAHSAPNGNFEACIMEAAAFVAGEIWTDHPECTCPVIASFMRGWNDGLPSDEDRTRLLLPFVPAIVGTKGSEALEERRSLMAADWLVRVHTPAWLRLAGLKDQAATLEALPEIASLDQAATLRGPLEAIYKDAGGDAWGAAVAPDPVGAWAAGAGALDACRVIAADALDAAWAARRAAADAAMAAWTVTRAACRIAAAAVADAMIAAENADAALDAAKDACRATLDEDADDADAVDDADAAVDDADAAFWAASDAAADAEGALKDIATELQQSALVLVERMIALTDDDLAKAA